jgi:hypothetical protein
MRPWPINPPTIGAEPIMVIIMQGTRFCSQSIGHVLLACGLEQSVALEAACEGGNCSGGARQCKASENFNCLPLRIVGSRTEAVLDNRVHEQAAVASQDCTSVGRHDLEKATIFRLRFVSAVYTKESEIAYEAAKMTVHDEPFAMPPLQARVQGKNVFGRGESIDIDPP